MEKKGIKKAAIVIAVIAALALGTVFAFFKPQSKIYAAGDTYNVSSEADLTDALQKVNDNDLIRLDADITMDTLHFIDLQKTLTFDLNGHTLTSAKDYDAIEMNGEGKTLTIMDSAGGGVLMGDSNTILVAGKNNALVIDSGSIADNVRQNISVVGEGNKLTVNGGTIANGVWIAGMDIEMNVHGGTISSYETAVEMSGTVKFNMDGGVINGRSLALSVEDELLKQTDTNTVMLSEEAAEAASAQEEAIEPEGEPEDGEEPAEDVPSEETPEEVTEEEPTEAPTEAPTTAPEPAPVPPLSHNTDVAINISGGELISTFDSAIFFPEKGTLTITGGEITGHTAVYLQSGKTTITGGKFVAQGEYVEFEDTGDYSGCTATGDAIVVEACENDTGLTQVYIEGGTFISQNGRPIASYQASDGPQWSDDTAQRIGEFVYGGWFGSKVSNEGDVYTQNILAKGLHATEAVTPEEGAQEGAPYTVGLQVSFDANGGNEIKDVYLAPLGDPNHGGTLKAFPTPTRENCNFVGWFDAASGGKEVKGEGPVLFASDITLYAHWDIAQFKIKYDLDGGKLAQKNPETYTADTADFTLTNPTKEGFYFKGWTGTGLNEPTQTVKITKGSNGDREYKANWGVPGEIKNGTDAKTNACHAKIDDTLETLGGIVLNAEDVKRVKNGENITIKLKATDVSTTITKENKAAIDTALEEGSQAGLYLDMNVYKTVGSDNEVAVTNPKGNITITLTVPDEIIQSAGGDDRTFGIVHLHNGLAQRVDAVYNKLTHTLTFKTSNFSYFALTYKDQKAPEVPTETPGGDSQPKKNSSILSSWIFWVVVAVVVIIAVLIVVLTTLKKKRNRRYDDSDDYDGGDE